MNIEIVQCLQALSLQLSNIIILTMKRIFSLIMLMLSLTASAQTFSHPGMLHTASDLESIRVNILSGKQPWADAWQQLKDSKVASVDYKATPWRVVSNGSYNKPDNGGSDFVRDGAAAYTMALQWWVERDTIYAEKAIEIMNDWACTLDSVVNQNRQLKIGTGGIKYLNAAEIIKCTYPHWKESDRKAFERMVIDIWYPTIKDWTPRYNGNWDAAIGQTMLCIGVFMDRRDIFDAAVEMLTYGNSNGAIVNYVSTTGQCQESGRDQNHVQMGLGFWGCAAEVAWNQGVDLYGTADNRYLMGLEYTAKFMCGEDVPYEQYTTWYGRKVFGEEISQDKRDRVAPIWERPYHHYHNRKGYDMPYTRKMVEKSRPEGTDPQSFVPWGTLSLTD